MGLHKVTATRIVLSCLAGRPVNLDLIPVMPDMEGRKNPQQTIEAVPPVRLSDDALFLDAEGTQVPKERLSPRLEQAAQFAGPPLQELSGPTPFSSRPLEEHGGFLPAV
jgi:hypothetical protein